MLKGFVISKGMKERRGIILAFGFYLPFFFFFSVAFKQTITRCFMINLLIPEVVITLDMTNRDITDQFDFILVPGCVNDANVVAFQCNGKAIQKMNHA